MRSSNNLLVMLGRASPSAFLHQIEVSSARSRESFCTSCSSVAAGSGHTVGPFLFRTGATGRGGTKGKRSSKSLFSLAGSFLVVYHPHRYPHPCLVYELDRLVFALT